MDRDCKRYRMHVDKLNASNEQKFQRMAKQLKKAKENIHDDRIRWTSRLFKLNRDLDEATDRAYLEKKTRRDAVQAQLEKSRG